MCKFLIKLSDKLCASKPNSYVFPAKSINLYFNNSLEKQFKIINLTSLSSIDFQTLEISENEVKKYKMFAILNNQSDNILDIATFNTEVEANDAIIRIRVELTKTSNGIVKTISILILLAILSGIIFSISASVLNYSKQETTTIQNISQNQPIENNNYHPNQPTGPLPTAEEIQNSLPQIQQTGTPSISEGDLKQMFEQAQNQQNAGMGVPTQPQSQQVPVLEPEQIKPPLSPTDKLIQGLK